MAHKEKNSGRPGNALVLGIFSQAAVLPWEDGRDFAQLYAGLRAEWAPDGALEEESLVQLAELLIRKRRLVQAAYIEFRTDPAARKLKKEGAVNPSGVRKYLRRLARRKQKFERHCEDVLKLFEKFADSVEVDDVDTATGDIQNFKTFAKAAIAGLGRLETEAHAFTSNAGFAYAPKRLEKILRTEAMLDARVDKTIARIVNVKEYKRIEAARLPRALPKS